MPEKDSIKKTNKTNERSHETANPAQAPEFLTEKELSPAESLRVASQDLGRLAPGNILALQRAVGNRAVIQLLTDGLAHTIQPGSGVHRQVIQRTQSDNILDYEPQIIDSLRASGLILAGGDLSRDTEIKDFTDQAYNYVKAYPQKTRIMFAQDMIKIINLKLLSPVTMTFSDPGEHYRGEFQHDTANFNISINTAEFSEVEEKGELLKELTPDETSKVIETFYHEARHAEQILLVAQMMAGDGKEIPAKISTDLSIPLKVAQAAASFPLNQTTERNKEQIKEAKKWKPFLMSGGFIEKYMKNIRDHYGDMLGERGYIKLLEGDNEAREIKNDAGPLVNIVKDDISNFEANLSKPDSITGEERLTIEAEINSIKTASSNFESQYDELANLSDDLVMGKKANIVALAKSLKDTYHHAYQYFAHEKDAFAIGEKAGEKFRKKFPAPR